MAVSFRTLAGASLRANRRQAALFGRLVTRRFIANRGLQTASALTYTSLLSLVPLLVVSLALLSAFGAVADMRETVQRTVLEVLVPTAEMHVVAQIDQFLGNARTLTAPGLAAIVVTAVMLLFTIESTFNRIWQVASPRSLTLRLLRYWTVLTLGPLLLGSSLSLTSYFFVVADDEIIRGAMLYVSRLLPITLQWLAFTLLYMAIPHARVRAGHAAIGGFVAAVLFEGLKLSFAIYVDNADNFRVIYGALAAIPIFLMWLYASWTVILVGAEVTAALPQWRRDLSRDQTAARSAAGRLRVALALLQRLWSLAGQGGGLNRDSPEALEAIWAGDVLRTLIDGGFVAETADGSLVLARDLSRTPLLVLWQALDLGTPALEPDAALLATLRTRETAALQEPVSSLLVERGSLG